MTNRTAATSVLDPVHCRAICDEIGERLRYVLDREASEIPPCLLMLIDKLALLELAPSIVPSIEEMSLPLGPASVDSAKRSADLARPSTNRGLVFVGS
jgi:hypothetical protein